MSERDKGRTTEASFRSMSSTYAGKTRDEMYGRKSAYDSTKSGQLVNAVEIKIRESRDSEITPCSTPLIIGLDVTGSMGMLAEYEARKGLVRFVGQVLQRKSLVDPHLMFMGIGDAVAHDKAPLQLTQFETDERILTQLTDIWLEGGGGGNNFESYDLPWAFARYRTICDAWEKRQKKGYLFTMGDEMFPRESCQGYLQQILGSTCPQNATPEELYKAACERWHVFHLIIAEGNFARQKLERVTGSWKQRLQKRALVLTKHEYASELMVSAIEVAEGRNPDDVVDSWGEPVSGVIAKAFEIGN